VKKPKSSRRLTPTRQLSVGVDLEIRAVDFGAVGGITEKGLADSGIPESLLCVDCGTNTAPGALNRAETAAAFRAGADHVVFRVDQRSEIYQVQNTVWEAAGMTPAGGCLCIGCLERRLGRRLRADDFDRDHPFARLPGTPRLLARRKGAG
jgi:hypothetical protein